MYHDIHDVIDANKRAGQSFFSPSTMSFFKTRFVGNLYGGRYFVTSESEPGGTRYYTVREALPNGHIRNVSEFGHFSSGDAAKRAAQKLAEGK